MERWLKLQVNNKDLREVEIVNRWLQEAAEIVQNEVDERLKFDTLAEIYYKQKNAF